MHKLAGEWVETLSAVEVMGILWGQGLIMGALGPLLPALGYLGVGAFAVLTGF